VHCPEEFVAEEGSCWLVAEVDELNRRLKSNFLRHVVDLSFGIEPRFKGWVGRGQYNERPLALSSQMSDLSGMIARLLRLFQSRVLFAFNPDQADRLKGRKYG
jgi:hypothetical protein